MSNRKLPDGLRRLAHLADALEASPPPSFRLDTWHCGTACCAGGFAATLPEFMEEGLRLVTEVNVYAVRVPCYYGALGMQAMMDFFGLDADEANSLFYPTTYQMADWSNLGAVINRIRAMVSHKTALLMMLTV